ncbi:MAG: DUF4276 family protein [Aggregatilineales bacterium]
MAKRVNLFVEDQGHEAFLRALFKRFAEMYGIEVDLHSANVRGGHGKAITELTQYLRDLKRGRVERADLLVAAIDANCKGYTQAQAEIVQTVQQAELGIDAIYAVPDPHLEHWLLSDSNAFKTVFGIGCQSPDQKCERDRYKKLLREAILKAGINPPLGGIEYAEDLVNALDLHPKTDKSLRRLLDDLRAQFNQWRK